MLIDSPTPDPTGSGIELGNKHIPIKNVNYEEILGNARVLFVGEDHSNGPIRLHLATNASKFRELGITHYLIEAAPDNTGKISQLNAGKFVDLHDVNCGPSNNAKYAVGSLSAAGIKIVPFDIDQTLRPSNEDREKHMFEVVKGILESEIDARLLILIGAFHTVKGNYGVDNIPSLRKRCEELDTGIRAVEILGGSQTYPTILKDAVKKAGKESLEFMVAANQFPSEIKLLGGPNHIDYLIHLPEENKTQPAPHHQIEYELSTITLPLFPDSINQIFPTSDMIKRLLEKKPSADEGE
jgi:hypothetical protein